MDKALLTALYTELCDFSGMDKLDSYERQDYLGGVMDVAGDIRFSLQEGLDFDLSKTQITAKPTGEPSREYLSLLLGLLDLRAERARGGVSPQFLSQNEEVRRLLNYYVDTPEKQLLLSEAWDMFFKFKTSDKQKRPWSETIQQNNLRAFNNILLVMGDRPVQSISKRDVKDCLVILAQFPQRNKKPYKDMKLEDILSDLDATPEEDTVSSKWVSEHLKLMQSFFSAYLKKEVDILEKSPTEDVKWDVTSVPYAAYSNAEINKIEKEATSLDGWKKWILLLGIYSGCRRSELASLTMESFHKDEDSSLDYFFIGKAKTAAGIRKVPVHQRLIELGFLDFVQASKGSKVFPELTSYNAITRHIDLVRDKLEIPPTDVEGFRKSFHSFRHTFITKAREKGNDKSLIQVVVGHQGTRDVTDIYTHTSSYGIKVLADIVNSVEFGK
ncbi:tyrosine-type recombinase/integrase [Oceanisphaera sp.]|uniref:tyrosine-type recombinase/integrase n=1 Tax=Oceanisphaera sp. TaxID=1929979 RepID=UPI003A942FCA